MKDTKKILRRGFNRLIFNTPIRSYKDPIEGVDYKTFPVNNDNKKLGIGTNNWDVVIDLNTLEVTETEKDLFISFHYTVTFNLKEKYGRMSLNKKDEKLLTNIFQHILMREANNV